MRGSPPQGSPTQERNPQGREHAPELSLSVDEMPNDERRTTNDERHSSLARHIGGLRCFLTSQRFRLVIGLTLPPSPSPPAACGTTPPPVAHPHLLRARA